MKKFLAKFVLLLALTNAALLIHATVVDASAVPSPLEYIKIIGDKTKLPNYVDTGVHPDAPADIQPGVATVSSPIYFIIDLFRYFVSGIAFIVIIIAAIKLVSTANEEEAGKSKNTLIIGIIGLLVIQLADTIVKKMFFGEQGEAFQDIATAQLYAEESVSQIRGIIGFTEIFLGAVAVLIIIVRGFVIITSAGEEETIKKSQKHIIYAVVGLVVVGLSEVVVRGVIFPEAGKVLPDIDVGKKLLVSITNFLSGFVALISFVMLFYAGYRYVASGGEEEVNEKVKKIFLGAAMGLILAFAAFAIVNTLVTFEARPGETTATPKQPEVIDEIKTN